MMSPGWCGSVDWAPACTLKGHPFDSHSGLMTGLRDNWLRYLLDIDVSLSPSPPISLKINKSFLKKKRWWDQMKSLGWAVVHCDWGPCKKRWQGHRSVQREDHVKMWRHRKGGHLQARERGPRRNHHTATLTSDFQPPELWENKCLLFEQPSLQRFVWAALADKHNIQKTHDKEFPDNPWWVTNCCFNPSDLGIVRYCSIS